MNLLSRFTRPDYANQDDFLANYSYTAPEGFNFARDVIDEYARLAPYRSPRPINCTKRTSPIA